MAKEVNKTFNFKNLTIAIIPFIFLFSIALIEGNITYHQKVFKTFMIFFFDVALLLILLVNIFGEKNEIEKPKKYLLYFALYFFYIFFQYIVSFFSGEICYDRNYYLADYGFLIIFAMFFYFYFKDIKEIKRGLILLGVFLIITLIISMLEFFQLRMEMLNEALKNNTQFNWGVFFSRFRPKLTFGNTDYFSGYMVGVLPLSVIAPFVFYDTSKKFSQNILAIALAIVALLGFIPLFFSQTRAAWLGIFIGIVFVMIPSAIIMQDKLSKFKKIIIISAMMFCLIALPLIVLKSPIAKSLFPRMVTTLENPMFAINDRLNGWSGALGLFKNHPIFGAGLGGAYASSFKYMGKYYYIYSDSNSFKHAHCEFVEVLGEGGLFGTILFFFLFGFIIINMLKRAYSKKYEFAFRLICLGVAVGIISMLGHQTFSLSLRMSVTKTAYFFLLGLGVFLMSYSNKALKKGEVAKQVKFFPAIFEKNIKLNQMYIMLGSFGVLLIVGLFLFLPVFSCEFNFRQTLPFGSKSINETEYFMKKAINAMPGNPYAWTQKYTFDSEYKLMSYFKSIESSNASPEMFAEIDKVFDDIVTDLNHLNAIIPGYQDVWSKYANIYLTKYQYLLQKWQIFKKNEDLNQSQDCLKYALEYLNKSTEMNALSYYSHVYKLAILTYFGNKVQYEETIKDIFVTKIYVSFARGKRIVKEKISINFTQDAASNAKLENDKYVFNISLSDVANAVEKTYSIREFDAISKSVTETVDAILIPLYEKAMK
ncbi:MAG: hypothetical protein A2086_11715 [Spirochaetes bacterium GWD1_27_9]|nr:MAG: hypothetical protein A2Z98_02225 [Spirochaetes bacterium GWB1_27_13]OHD28629.1 MAG: hypothetical protein A2086_11715 [Spirochaetes bacterium GWD1_27_9]